MRARLTGLWHHSDFMKLWAGQTISVFGSQITLLALPMIAILLLDASATQMGILTAAGTLPYLLVGLPAGVWVDRLRRRPILIAADVGRAALLATVPLAAALGLLRIEFLCLVTFLVGVLTLFFDVTEEAYLPALIGREHLLEGNSKLALSNAIAEIGGPGVAGALLQAVSAPVALVVNVCSFLASAMLLGRIRTTEPAPPPPKEQRRMGEEIREGLHVALRHPLLRPMTATSSTLQFFGGIKSALFIMYVTRGLGLSPAVVGLFYAVGSFSGLMGTLWGGEITRRLGPGPTIVSAAALIGVGWLSVPLASGPPIQAISTLVIGALFAGMGNMVYNIGSSSLSQAITPDRLLGRVNASRLFIMWGMLPIGSLVGGALGAAIGLRPALFGAGGGLLLGFLWVFFSPLRTLREQPDMEPLRC